jgi:hypothetical protein
MRRLLLIISLLLGNTATTSATIVLLKDRPDPLIGTLLRDEKDRVVLRTVDAEGKSHEQTIQRSEIDQVMPAFSPQRLAALDPAKPAMYLEYAEELRARRRDPEARDMALRLYLTAAWLDRAHFGRAGLLGMISLARSPQEEQKFRAALYLVDPRTTVDSLQSAAAAPATASEEDYAAARELLRAVRLLRTGKGVTARSIIEKPAVDKLLANYSRIFSKADFNAAAGHTALERRELRQALLLELELDALLNPTAAATEQAASLAWSRELQGPGSKAVPSLALETLTEFDPRQCVWREGKWAEK